jgi:ribosome-binding protein aMBF1 (putative translation factor)
MDMEFRCELCGKEIVRNRYLVRIASYAAYDGLEINILDLTRDFGKEIEDLLKKIKKKRRKKLEKDICVGFEFVLCKNCRDNYVRDPLGKKRLKSSR